MSATAAPVAPAPRRRASAAARIRRLKAACLLLVTVPAAWMLLDLALDRLGARPLTALIHRTGFWTVRLLLATLAISPARALFDWRAAPALRRILGVATFCYAAAHFTLYVLQEGARPVLVIHELTHRVYLAIGFAALAGLATLAATSTDGAVRRLGRRWRALHRWIFVIASLGLLHFFMQSKIDVGSATTYAGLFLFLACWRAWPKRWGGPVAAAWALALLAGILAAELEAGWYDVATRIDPARVLRAELGTRFGLRPAASTLAICLGVALAASLWALGHRAVVNARAGAGHR